MTTSVVRRTCVECPTSSEDSLKMVCASTVAVMALRPVLFPVLTNFFFFKHSISSWAQEPHKVLGRLGGAGRGDEGGNSGGRIPDGLDVLREAEAAEALHSVRRISSRAVRLYSDHLQRFWLPLRHNIHFKCALWLSLLCEINCVFLDLQMFLCLQHPIFFMPLFPRSGFLPDLSLLSVQRPFCHSKDTTVTRAVA